MTISLVVLVTYALIWASVITSNKINERSSKQLKEASQKQFDGLSPEKKAIIRAENYTKDTLSTFKLEQRLGIDYLQRKFDLDTSLSATISQFQVPENPATYPQEIHFLARLAYPDSLVIVPPRSTVDGVALTNIYSANCDHMQLHKDFWATINQNYVAGGYSLTHNALAFAFMKDNGCTIPSNETEIVTKTIDGMVKIASDQNTIADLRYEAIAFLGLSGRSDLIDQAWIDRIVTEQKDNGGWQNTGNTNDSDHTTVLALWALLEYTRPNTPYEPLIRRPTGGS